MKEITLTQGKIALVDDEDFDRVRQFKWHAARRKNIFYVSRTLPRSEGRLNIFLHHLVLPGHKLIDHIDGDGLNNQKQNLRPATHSQNHANTKKYVGGTSRFKGVHWDSARGCWAVKIRVMGETIHLGRYFDEADAAGVYDYAAKIHFGDFARLNFNENKNASNDK